MSYLKPAVCFHAKRDSSLLYTAVGPITLNSTPYSNLGGGMSGGIFTAPVDGTYSFKANFLERWRTANGHISVSLYVNGSRITPTNLHGMAWSTTVGTSDHENHSIELVRYLNAGDTVQPYIDSIDSNQDIYDGESLSNFSGYLIA